MSSKNNLRPVQQPLTKPTLDELKVKAFDKAFEVQALKEAVIKAQAEQEELLQMIKDYK